MHRGELEKTAADLLALAKRQHLAQSRDAVVLAESAAAVAHSVGAFELEGAAGRLGAQAAYEAGELDRAETNYLRARAAAQALDKLLDVGAVSASLGFVAYDRGQTMRAQEWFDSASAIVERWPEADVAAGRLRARVEGYRGNLARQSFALEDARTRYRAAIATARAAASDVLEATFMMDLGAAELADGRFSEAALWLGRAARAVPTVVASPPRILLAPLVAHYQALLAMATGGPAAEIRASIEIPGPPALTPIRTWLYDATRCGNDRPRIDASLRRRLVRLREDAVPYEHARFGTELLIRWVGLDDEARTVSAARDGSLVARGGQVTDLSSREPLRRVLHALLRASERGGALSLGDLVDAGWPEERIAKQAAKNRAHVALSTLRSIGLSDVLVRSDGGYALDLAAMTVLD